MEGITKMTLYKYTPIEHIKSCIEKGIFASNLDNINDPYEGKGIRYKDQYRVVCLTASPIQMLMWAYYGNHRGCCVEFDVNRVDGLRRVDYIKTFQSHEDMDTKQVIESLYCKGYEWKHENEYRIVYHKKSADRALWEIDKDKIYFKAPAKRIIFGLAAEMNSRYIEILEYLKEYNETHKPSIEVTKCRLMSDKYQLETDKQFDLDAEISSLKSYEKKKNKRKIQTALTGEYEVDGERVIFQAKEIK